MRVFSVHRVIDSGAMSPRKKVHTEASRHFRVPCNDTCSINFCAIRPASISYIKPIKKIESALKKLGVNAILLYDGSEKNLILAKKMQVCFAKLKEKNITIPKMTVDFVNWRNVFVSKDSAAVTDISWEHNKPIIEVFFKPKSYTQQSAAGDLFRIKEMPQNSTFESDFFHEFAHAHQGFLCGEKKFNQLRNEKFDQKINDKIAREINSYATQSKTEFVAEYFCYKMTGKEIKSKMINELYKQCNGPEIC